MSGRVSRQVMPCPVCRTELQLAERQGIEIDWCPGCRGVWLDRGELDKILERSVGDMTRHASRDRFDDDDDDDHRRFQARPGKHRRRKSWLEELFD